MLGAPRASNPLARSAKPGGGSIPLAPSIYRKNTQNRAEKPGCISRGWPESIKILNIEEERKATTIKKVNDEM